LTRADIDASV
jgi:hypothetical protein